MENIEIMDILITLIIIGGGIYFRSYIKEKGENLATKDDVSEITDKIENVKHDYAAKLENLKTTMQAKLQIDHVRYQNEYKILAELTEKLVELRDAAVSLSPIFDQVDPNESENDRKKRRLARFSEAAKQYYLLAANKEPFMPEDIFAVVDQLQRKCRAEAIRYAHRDQENDSIKYWQEAEKNAKEIETASKEVIENIRTRVQTWEV